MHLLKVLGIWLHATCIANLKYTKKKKFYLFCIPKVGKGGPLLLYFTAIEF